MTKRKTQDITQYFFYEGKRCSKCDTPLDHRGSWCKRTYTIERLREPSAFKDFLWTFSLAVPEEKYVCTSEKFICYDCAFFK